jgi:Mn2+/Fe2+ NRAMP family transporter
MSAESSAAQSSPVELERAMLLDAEAKGGVAKLSVWAKLSGPGWLQSAITLGGGSLGSSLFLGILAGYSFLWLQVLAMFCGVVMLGAIGYVTLSTGERPFGLVNRQINPVLGWSWALATMAANIVWCLPQFSLAEAAISQNLIPGLADQKAVSCGVLLLVAICVTMLYDSGGKGLKIYENCLRIMVAVVVLSFFGVAVKLLIGGGVDLGQLFSGLIPDLSLISNPAPALAAFVQETGVHASHWHDLIVDKQRDVMVSAAATAVGINMTFLFPYSLLRKGWDRHFRGLSLFDLATGMAIPFILATGCVVVASASSFHAKPAEEITQYWPAQAEKIDGKLKGDFEGLLIQVVQSDNPGMKKDDARKQIESLPAADIQLASMLANRDVLLLSKALAPLTGDFVANYLFGLGVVAMALSTITILMLISGFTFCEVFGFPHGSTYHRIGAMLPAVGVLGPFIWKKAAAYLVVPTSVFGMALLPIAYLTFLLLMNNKSVLGDDLPRGRSRIIWNLLMGFAFALSTIGAGWVVWSKSGWKGVGFVVALIVAALVVHVMKKPDAVVASDNDA